MKYIFSWIISIFFIILDNDFKDFISHNYDEIIDHSNEELSCEIISLNDIKIILAKVLYILIEIHMENKYQKEIIEIL